jgi:hypothetical protein
MKAAGGHLRGSGLAILQLAVPAKVYGCWMLLFGHTASTNRLFLRCGAYVCNALLPSGVKVVSKVLMGGPDASLHCEDSAYLSSFSGDGREQYG